MKDGKLIRSVKFLALCRYCFDLRFTRMIAYFHGDPRYRLCGECANCGKCCRTPMIHVSAFFFYFKTLRALFLNWHRIVNGFVLIEERRKERTFVFECTHYDPVTKSCDSYSSRPGMCRDYPRNLLYQPNPTFIDGCTYKAVVKDAASIEESLSELDLPPDKLAKVRKAFYLDDVDD